MLIRCPECSFTRQVNDSKVPAGSEHATCPKCKKRFRFRTLSPEEIAQAQPEQGARSESPGRYPASENLIQEASDASHRQREAGQGRNQESVNTFAHEAIRGFDGQADGRPEEPAGNQVERNTATETEHDPADDVWSAVENLNKRWEENARPGAGKSGGHGGFDGSDRSGEFRRDEHGRDDFFSLDGDPSGDRQDDSFGAGSMKRPPAGHEQDAQVEDNKFFQSADAFRDADDEAARKQRRETFGKVFEDESEEQDASRDLAEHRPEAYDRRGTPKYSGRYDQDDEPESGADFSAGNKPSFLADSGSVPWEYRGGFFNPQALIRTILLSFTRIPEFFGGIPARGSLLPAMIFALLMRGLQFVITFAFVKFDFITPEGERINASLAGIAQISIPELVITTVFIVILLQFVSSWIVNFMVRLVSGRANFSLTFRVVAYSLSPLVFVLIPQLGLMIGEIGSLTLFTLGLRHAYRLSWQKTMMVMIPLMLLMFLINLSTLRVFAG